MKHVVLATIVSLGTALAWADDDHRNANCAGMPGEAQLKQWLQAAPNTGGDAGGLFHGRRMWGAIVNRDGELCVAASSQSDPNNVWPASLAIAKAKAFTANSLSLDDFALSTARLYTFTQPGHSLWSLGQSNLFDPKYLAAPGDAEKGKHQITGGLIFFGGGVPLYRNGKIIGGLGISGDTSCTDHEIAKRVRHLASLDPPASLGGMLGDDIVYDLSVFAHPVCINTYKNGIFVGNEARAVYPRE
ncbi:MAG TPA: heme-binding protein [Bryobacteraceae bacterium]|nr:heme-binding protein [Bryobacteraceae bacterium]